MREPASHVVWVRSSRGMSLQVLFGDPTRPAFVDEGVKNSVVQTHTLKPHERGMSLDALVSIYPAPPLPEGDAA
jgi:hypothetical protein